jgi:cell division protein FtsB
VSYQNLEPVSKQLTIVVGLTVVGFMAFGLALSFYRNILFEETLQAIGNENEKIETEIRESREQIDYFKSAQYKDKYAKENLGRLNPGEKIIIIQESVADPAIASGALLASAEEREAVYQEHLRDIPVYLHWRLFLFERGRIDQLKRGL